jgi:hypothetical protein
LFCPFVTGRNHYLFPDPTHPASPTTDAWIRKKEISLLCASEIRMVSESPSFTFISILFRIPTTAWIQVSVFFGATLRSVLNNIRIELRPGRSGGISWLCIEIRTGSELLSRLASDTSDF